LVGFVSIIRPSKMVFLLFENVEDL